MFIVIKSEHYSRDGLLRPGRRVHRRCAQAAYRLSLRRSEGKGLNHRRFV